MITCLLAHGPRALLLLPVDSNRRPHDLESVVLSIEPLQLLIFIYAFIYLFIYVFIYLCIYLVCYLLIHLLIKKWIYDLQILNYFVLFMFFSSYFHLYFHFSCNSLWSAFIMFYPQHDSTETNSNSPETWSNEIRTILKCLTKYAQGMFAVQPWYFLITVFTLKLLLVYERSRLK